MPEKFDWQTDEETRDDWEQERGDEVPRKRPHRLLLVMLLLLLGLAGYTVYAQLERHLASVQAQVTEEVRASDRLARSAAADQDEELFRTVLSGRDEQWTNVQHRLLEEKLLFANAARALYLQPTDATTGHEDITISPDLNEAEVVTQQTYTTTDASRTTVALRQTLIYRRGPNRWLLSPPDAEFWGEWQSWQGERLTLIYPGRDVEVANRLGPDLDSTLAEMCTRFSWLDCTRTFPLEVRLEKDPQTLLVVNEPLGPEIVAGEIDLPTPTLVGLPVDEAAYEALYRGYATHVVKAIMSRVVEYECCEHVLFYQALLDWQLHVLDLQPWPVTLDHYLLVADRLGGPSMLPNLWSTSQLEQQKRSRIWQVYALVELLMNQTDRDDLAGMLQQTLGAAPSLIDWLQQAGDYRSLVDVNLQWRSYLFERIRALQEVPPAPERDLVVACREGADRALYRYDVAQDLWTNGLPGLPAHVHVLDFIPFPDDTGLILRFRHGPGLWQQGQIVPLTAVVDVDMGFNTNPLPIPSRGQQSGFSDPLAQYMLAWTRDYAASQNQPGLLDVASCLNDICGLYPVTSSPIWSPDGQHMLLASSNSDIARAPRSGAPVKQVAHGAAPFWLNTSVYGYLSQGYLVLATVEDDTPQRILLLESLVEHVSPEQQLGVASVIAAPESGDLLLFAPSVTVGGDSAIFLLQRQDETVSWLEKPTQPDEISMMFQTKAQIVGPPVASLSPDGRWLYFYTIGEEEGRFYLYDLREGGTPLVVSRYTTTFPGDLPFTNDDWSSDGEWLAHLGPDHVELIAPNNGPYRLFLEPPAKFAGATPACTSVAWIKDPAQ